MAAPGRYIPECMMGRQAQRPRCTQTVQAMDYKLNMKRSHGEALALAVNINHNLNTYQDTIVWFVAIVAVLFLVFDEISKFNSDFCDNHRVAQMVRSRTSNHKNGPGSCPSVQS